MRHLLACGILASLTIAPSLAAQQAQTERFHDVRAGDTLWDLARQYLGDPFLWPEIFRANQALLANPDRIFPTERLRIPTLADRAVAGVPASTVESVPSVLEPVRLRPSVFAAPAATATQVSSIRRVERDQLPTVLPGDFHRAGLLVPETEVVPLGQVVELLNPTPVPMAIPALIGLYDEIYLTLATPGGVRVGDRLQLIRRGREVKPYGRIFVSTGMVTVKTVDGSVALAEVSELYEAVTLGDLVVPVLPAPSAVGVEPQPAAGVEGTLIAFQSPHVLQGPQDLGFLDLGRQSGVAPGDEFLVYLAPERERWGVRPEVEVARLQVVKVSERTAAFRVVDLHRPALEPGLPVRLVGKIP